MNLDAYLSPILYSDENLAGLVETSSWMLVEWRDFVALKDLVEIEVNFVELLENFDHFDSMVNNLLTVLESFANLVECYDGLRMALVA